MPKEYPTLETFVSIPKAAKLLGIKYHALLRAVNCGLIKSYHPFNSRRLVLISEVKYFVTSCATGGAE